MHKTKILIGLTTLICGLAAMSSPANAFFQAATENATSGPIASFPENSALGISSKGIVVTTVNCLSTATTKATGLWQIQNSEETVVTSGTKEQKQPLTKVGPHEAITITNWGTCAATLGAEKAPASVSPCRLQIAQPAKNTAGGQAATGSVQTDCVIKVPALVCTLIIEQLPVNHNLKIVSLTNIAAGGVEIKANVKGFTYKGEGAGCASVGLKEGTEATFSTGPSEGNETIKTAGQKLV